VSLSSFRWEETGVSLADYRRRIKSISLQWVAWLPIWLPAGCSMVAAVLGHFTGDGLPTDNAVTLVYAGVGLIFGGVLGYLLRPMLLRQFLGVDFHSID
jgi:hypothetical protein